MPVNNITDIIESGAFALQPSSPATGTVVANGATIVAHEVGIARIAPASAVTGLILAPGDYDGQFCTVQNKSAFASTATFDVAATSNMAAGLNEVIPGGTSKDYKWDANSARWVGFAGCQPVPFLAPHAGVLATADTITPPAALYSKCLAAPAGNVTGIILAVGVIDGQELTLVNNANFTVTPAVTGTSHVADGAQAVPAFAARTFIWDATAALWFREA